MGPLFFPVVLIAACFDEFAQRLQFGHVFVSLTRHSVVLLTWPTTTVRTEQHINITIPQEIHTAISDVDKQSARKQVIRYRQRKAYDTAR